MLPSSTASARPLTNPREARVRPTIMRSSSWHPGELLRRGSSWGSSWRWFGRAAKVGPTPSTHHNPVSRLTQSPDVAAIKDVLGVLLTSCSVILSIVAVIPTLNFTQLQDEKINSDTLSSARPGVSRRQITSELIQFHALSQFFLLSAGACLSAFLVYLSLNGKSIEAFPRLQAVWWRTARWALLFVLALVSAGSACFATTLNRLAYLTFPDLGAITPLASHSAHTWSVRLVAASVGLLMAVLVYARATMGKYAAQASTESLERDLAHERRTCVSLQSRDILRSLVTPPPSPRTLINPPSARLHQRSPLEVLRRCLCAEKIRRRHWDRCCRHQRLPRLPSP